MRLFDIGLLTDCLLIVILGWQMKLASDQLACESATAIFNNSFAEEQASYLLHLLSTDTILAMLTTL